MACASDFVTFAGGLTLPTAVWLLALDLESRGVQMVVGRAARKVGQSPLRK